MTDSQSWWRGPDEPERPELDLSMFKSEPMPLPALEENEPLPNRRIHILGLGSIGCLVAHSLRCLPNPPPISLLLHRPNMFSDYKLKGRLIRLVNLKTEINDEQTGYDVDLLEKDPDTGFDFWRYLPDTPDRSQQIPTHPAEKEELLDSGEVYISNLIVTVKGPATVAALRSVKHRLNSQSTICLVQNGMGQIDELNQKVFTEPHSRPTYLLGIISHGCYMSGSFKVVHAGFGATALGIYRDTDKFPLPPQNQDPNIDDLSEEQRKQWYPTDKELYFNLSARYMLRTLTRSPVLACAAFPYLDLLQLQLEKLSSNALLNPMTALLDVPNGQMLGNHPLSVVQRLLLAEISLVIRGLPELKGIPGLQARFSPYRLEKLFSSVAEKTAANSSSMREDVRNRKSTEIDYINGYIVKRGELQGIRCVLNYMIMQLVKGKSTIQAATAADILPYGTSRLQGEIRPESLGEPSGITLEDAGIPGKGSKF